MPFIRGTYIDGKVVLDAPPADWPGGTRVEVSLEYDTSNGMRDEDWPTTPEGIEELVRRMESLEPMEITPEEEADFKAWSRKCEEYGLAKEARVLDDLFP